MRAAAAGERLVVKGSDIPCLPTNFSCQPMSQPNLHLKNGSIAGLARDPISRDNQIQSSAEIKANRLQKSRHRPVTAGSEQYIKSQGH